MYITYVLKTSICIWFSSREHFLNVIKTRDYDVVYFPINLLAPELFFLILAQPVYKIWLIQEPNTLELWNKLHFWREKTESMYRV